MFEEVTYKNTAKLYGDALVYTAVFIDQIDQIGQIDEIDQIEKIDQVD